VDNLGFGELSCYSGGPFRGCVTERIDAFAQEGFRLTNYCPESQCTPTRSALLTGRHAIRSGTHSVPIGQEESWGLVAWEKTLGDVLSEAGYACAEGYLYWMGSELYGAKWRNFKLILVNQKFETDAPARLATPRLINLITDPQEREPIPLPYLHTWTATHLNRLIAQFQATAQREPLIPLGAPLDHVPTPLT
jgi:arylsulfatase A-like enzyme